jgi:hypothetical protein
MTHVEKKDLLGIQTAGLSLSGSEWSGLAELGSGLYRRGQAMGKTENLCFSYLWTPDGTGQHALLVE